ncbi:YbaB/EbfC family nucleoid-associated protein [Sphaerisporangium perillae]|uniref:YbaB/EbfC family nucleoid-associated protein n=1 Tax=Sphaerisporangium perillae TaxID=2935860 RepID=UPI00200E4937|nr:YbaB/EbfC family nucleoid-associated protein [Sphaerisporangium perillae]
MTTSGGPIPTTGDPEVDQVLETLATQSARFEEVGRLISDIRGRGEAEDGRVVVEVLPSGSLASLTIDPRAMRLGSQALAEAILAAAKEAEEDATRKAETLMSPLLDDPPPYGHTPRG